MIAVTNEDFILTARAKGLKPNTIRYKHILRNSMLPIVTSLGMSISGLIGGQVVIEQVFNWNGMGDLVFGGQQSQRLPVDDGHHAPFIRVYDFAILVTDLVYVLLDPRVTVGDRR